MSLLSRIHALSRSVRMSFVVAVLAAASVLFVVLGPGPTAQYALLGLALLALASLGALHAAGIARVDTHHPGPPAEDRRLRGNFRRQHRPDSPGRPMPRAPGAVIGPVPRFCS
nr:DUF6412 domain-containing protein [Rhodococcus sp. (in: high G+C Gram-positive bacteria)]